MTWIPGARFCDWPWAVAIAKPVCPSEHMDQVAMTEGQRLGWALIDFLAFPVQAKGCPECLTRDSE